MVKELVLAVVPFDPHARPIAGTYCALIVRAVMPSNALADFETFGLAGVIAFTANLQFDRAFQSGNAAQQTHRKGES